MKKEVHRRILSFKFAAEGIRFALRTQVNMRIHFAVSVCVLILSGLLRLQWNEFLWILSAMTFVLSAELINTAIEKAVDLAEPNRHPLAKAAKDCAAAAVLVAAAFAVVAGVAVFYEPLREWASAGQIDRRIDPAVLLTIVLTLFVLVMMTLYALWPSKDHKS